MDKTIDLHTIKTRKDDYISKQVTLSGWVKNKRLQKHVAFLNFNDGTTVEGVQLICKPENIYFDILNHITISSSVIVRGIVVLSQKNNIEISVKDIRIIVESPNTYPIQPKKHSNEFLRRNSHLRARTKLYYCVFSIRNTLSFAIHRYFQNNRFVYVNTPIFTSIDAEGAGEMFTIENGDSFFGRKANLTVTGQLHAEALAMGFRKVYTFGPTFRADKSNTTRHISEFWMIEPEIAFANLDDIIDLSKELLKYISNEITNHCSYEIEYLQRFNNVDIYKNIDFFKNTNIEKIDYTDAINLLKESTKEFEQQVFWGIDLSSEHEKYLTDIYFKKPVFVVDYPKKIKAFYMLQNGYKPDTVAAMDLLVPHIGELIGGSSREYRVDKLISKIKEYNIPQKDIQWYIDINKFGGVPHSGFGIGFERLIMCFTGMKNIKDVIPFPRSFNSLNF